MSAWIYILRLCNGKYYVGSTSNLDQRILDHSRGKSPYTKKFLPVVLMYSFEFDNLTEAIKMEKYIKRLKNRKVIENIITSKTIKFEW